ncbi:MAG: hypothetical protein ACLTYN_05885 [Dysosmobacter welbionis]
MKRILTVLAATLLLTAAMAGTASASSYDSVAEELSAIGVFRAPPAALSWTAPLPVPRPPSCWCGSTAPRTRPKPPMRRERSPCPSPT